MSRPLNREQFIRAVLADVADLEWQIVEAEFLAQQTTPVRLESGATAYVLVVDDNQEVAKALALVPQRQRVCIVARGAAEARELCQGVRFDCAFVNMQLAGEGGLSFVTSLSDASRPSFVVMMSDRTSEDYLAALADGRINAYVQTPLSPALLPELLSQSLRRPET